ncbi:MAG: hypothetical protein AAF901_09420 [Bacteroidota bacterium]
MKHERIQQLIQHAGSLENFCAQTGLAPDLVSPLMLRTFGLHFMEILKSIAAAYPDVNITWLTTGVGDVWVAEGNPSRVVSGRMLIADHNSEVIGRVAHDILEMRLKRR